MIGAGATPAPIGFRARIAIQLDSCKPYACLLTTGTPLSLLCECLHTDCANLTVLHVPLPYSYVSLERIKGKANGKVRKGGVLFLIRLCETHTFVEII
jgi:hypothetical protein